MYIINSNIFTKSIAYDTYYFSIPLGSRPPRISKRKLLSKKQLLEKSRNMVIGGRRTGKSCLKLRYAIKFSKLYGR